MSRVSIVGAVAFAALASAAGCEDAGNGEVETVRSALGGSGGSGAGGSGDTVGSPIRGYTILGAPGGRGGRTETHAVVYRNGTSGAVSRRTGTPLGQPVNLGGNVAPGSAPWGYLRSDNVAAVLYVDVNRHVHEITPFGTGFRNLDTNLPPQSAPLASPAPAGGPVPDVIGYVRADNRTAMIYVDSNQHVIELLRNPGGNPPWVAYDLSVFANVQVEGTKRSAFPYARSDGYNAIVYVASDNHIHELAAFGTSGPGSGAWGDADLTAITGATPPSTDPWAYKRSDGYNSVVYIGTDSQMHELWLFPGGGWGHSILPAVSPRGGLWMRPSGFVRVDGVNAVFYVDDEGLVHELALLSGGWSDFVRSSDTDVAGQVFAHRATANLSSVVYQANDIEAVFHGFELRLPAGGNNWTFQQF